jgi:hypothetical protein
METDQAASHVEFFAKACKANVGSWKRAVQGQRTGDAYNHIPYLHITLGIYKNATFSLRKASERFIFR